MSDKTPPFVRIGEQHYKAVAVPPGPSSRGTVVEVVPRSVADTFAAALEDALVGELKRAPLAALGAYRAAYPREETP